MGPLQCSHNVERRPHNRYRTRLVGSKRHDAASAASIRSSLESAATDAETRLGVLHDYVVGTYNARVAALVSELRLFASRADMRPVLLPSAVMLVATIGAATVSVTQQN